MSWCVHCQNDSHSSPECTEDFTFHAAPLSAARVSVRAGMKRVKSSAVRAARSNGRTFEEWHDQWNCGLCRELQAFCRLHAEMNEEGYVPPRAWHFGEMLV